MSGQAYEYPTYRAAIIEGTRLATPSHEYFLVAQGVALKAGRLISNRRGIRYMEILSPNLAHKLSLFGIIRLAVENIYLFFRISFRISCIEFETVDMIVLLHFLERIP